MILGRDTYRGITSLVFHSLKAWRTNRGDDEVDRGTRIRTHFFRALMDGPLVSDSEEDQPELKEGRKVRKEGRCGRGVKARRG